MLQDFPDPHLGELELDGVSLKGLDLTDDVLESADLAVIITQHAEVDYDRVVARSNRVYDTRNATKDVAEGREKIRKL